MRTLRLPDSIHTRLLLSHLLVSLVSILLISAFVASTIITSARDELEYNLEDLATTAGNALEFPIQELRQGQTDAQTVKERLSRLLTEHPEVEFTIYMPDGAPIVDSGATLPQPADRLNAPEVWEVLNGEFGKGRNTRPNRQGDPSFFVAVPIQQEVEVTAILRLGTPIEPAWIQARRSLGLLALAALVVAAGVSLFGWRLASNMARPIGSLTRAAGQLARGNLQVRVKPSGALELRRLAETFNTMADRIQTHTDQLRAFVANASHELRTPLTVVKLRSEALQDGALEDPRVAQQFLSEIDTEVDRLVRMVNDLLDLSRMEAGMASSERKPLDLTPIAREAYETFGIRAAKTGVKFDVHLEPGLPLVVGNSDQIRRVLYNLVDNGIKYTQPGGRVTLTLCTGRKNGSVRLEVKDSGPGISAEHLGRVFERFFRVETTTRPRAGGTRGSGLGLAIAKSIVENHGGEIGVTSQIGEGSTFWAELPAQAED